MKSVIVLGDGMADWPVPALDGKTPLMVAKKPHIDRIARLGRSGRLVTIPKGQPNGSAVANLSVLGYDPAQTFQGDRYSRRQKILLSRASGPWFASFPGSV